MNGLDNRLQLGETLALARVCAPGERAAPAMAADDPLRLRLPKMPGPGASDLPAARVIRAMAALYLQAELEQTGLIVVAELLVQERHWLPIASVAAAEKLERFARDDGRWYDRKQRASVFARVFGLGEAAGQGAGNQAFEQRMASFCLSVQRLHREYRWGQAPRPGSEAALRRTALDLLLNLGGRQFGNTLPAAVVIQEQLDRAIDLLKDPGVSATFLTRGLWDTLRKILGPDTPDLGRLVDRGQSGFRLLNWLASVRDRLQGDDHQQLLPREDAVFLWTATWLDASGVRE